MSRHPFSSCLLTLWILFSALICTVKSGEIKNGELPAKNGWQPLVSSDNVGNVSPPSNYAAYTISQFDSERVPSYKISKQYRKSVDTIHQYDYTPPSILGSFSIFGHSIPKNRKGDDNKGYRESTNTNEYDFLVPPPRQRIESYQKMKISGDAYGGPSHYRDTIYTPVNTQFTFISTGAASSSSAAAVKKLPGIISSRDQLSHNPLRQYPTAGESYKSHSHPTQSSWMQNLRDNIDTHHLNIFRQYPVHIEGGNNFYTQIGHPPEFKSPYEVNNPSKTVVEQPTDYVTHHPGNLYAVQPSSSQRNEFSSFITPNTRYVEPPYSFDENSAGKQHWEESEDSALDNYYNVRKKNTTPSWLISTSKNQLLDLLPKLNKPVQFNRPNNATPHKAVVFVADNKLKAQIVREKIAPNIPKLRQETPESISLKHFNEQQFLLQQQLLERDRQKLEKFQTHQNPVSGKPIERHKERQSTPVESNFAKEFQVYEAVKLTNAERVSPSGQLSAKRNNVNYSMKQVDESLIGQSLIFDYSPKQVINNSTETDISTGKKKKGHHHRIIVNSEMNNYDRGTIYNDKNYTDVQPEKIMNTSIELENTTSPELFLEMQPTFTTMSGIITRTPQTSKTHSQGSIISPANISSIVPLVTDMTTRKSTIIKTRSQNRGPTRRRRPLLEPEPTSLSTSIQPTLISTEDTSEDYNYNGFIATPSYHSTEKSIIGINNGHKNESEHFIIQQEETANTVISEELTTHVTPKMNEASEEGTSSSKSPINEDNYKESGSSLTHINSPEEMTTKMMMERIRSTTRDDISSIAPLEYLFNLTETNRGDETSTQLSEWVPSVVEQNNNSNISNSSKFVEITTRPIYRLRPMKITNNTRPRFSVKDYKTRLDYRNRLSQTSTTQNSLITTHSMQLKSVGRYKYTPRYSNTKTKSSTQSYLPKSTNVTDLIEGKRNKISGYRPYTTAIQRKNNNNTTEMSNVQENKVQVNALESENRFVQPIRRRPQIKSSAQFAQMIKKNKNNVENTENTFNDSLTLITEPIPKKSELFTEKPVAMSTSTKSDKERRKFNDSMKDMNVNPPDPEKEQPITEIMENFSQHPSIQSDEEAFARASLSVADLTSSASALYNKPGMFKALSVIPAFESDVHKKTLTPTIDEPSLPIEAFFRELSNKEK
ncbi:uncharacterized protein LOC107036945 [Diachasma alloeum]|uniref:uncharacterized protein LOC107036945 n=1 Tax=Diachasma alloeum TaxID=454923 RepID=UPI00073814DA|nr:uncharacterized protein LOC107036945 [Diachasma alloeum]XP_015110701.1 uncharacterized protein LOC107036945 [Diachasma alloeum]XP_015110702.1 uncharacterized protein LOC107036945 [Diachasma alloeum]XP_015110703.1 uncharacterized protein LOC107036945 [Diachasma alloeum]